MLSHMCNSLWVAQLLLMTALGSRLWAWQRCFFIWLALSMFRSIIILVVSCMLSPAGSMLLTLVDWSSPVSSSVFLLCGSTWLSRGTTFD
jgi:hypothetical protein